MDWPRHKHVYRMFGHQVRDGKTYIWITCTCGPQSLATVNVTGALTMQDLAKAEEIWNAGRPTTEYRQGTDNVSLVEAHKPTSGGVSKTIFTDGGGGRGR